MTTPPFPILYEDNHLLVIAKPAGLVAQGAAEGDVSVVTLARGYLKEKYAKPGNVFLGVVSRLDAFVSGAMVLARTSKAAARLTEQFREGAVRKAYWAILEVIPAPPEAPLEHWLWKDDAAHRMRAAARERPDSQRALLTYRTLGATEHPESGAAGSRLEVELETGRKHQIRVQLAAIGHPIWGDRKYGAAEPFPEGIALHARRLELEHPTRREPLRWIAPLPAVWKRYWRE